MGISVWVDHYCGKMAGIVYVTMTVLLLIVCLCLIPFALLFAVGRWIKAHYEQAKSIICI